MNRFILHGLFILAIGASPAAANGDGALDLPLRLKPHALVLEDIVRLGDLFEGFPAGSLEAATPIARAPSPGDPVVLEANWLAALARRYELAWQPASHLERITVERDALIIPTAQIEDHLHNALSRESSAARIALILDNPTAKITLPGGTEPTLATAGLAHDPDNGRFVAQLVAPAQGPVVAQLRITGRAVEMVAVPVLRRNLVPGDVVGAGDIEWSEIRADRLARNTILAQDAVIGMTPRRPIRSGDAIRTGDLEAPTVVVKNSLVTIRLQMDRMLLAVQGRALEDGAAGEVIRVMNTKSNTVINATVVDAGTTEVHNPSFTLATAAN